MVFMLKNFLGLDLSMSSKAFNLIYKDGIAFLVIMRKLEEELIGFSHKISVQANPDLQHLTFLF